jgi:membrane protease YdiL (CAAX protease family)
MSSQVLSPDADAVAAGTGASISRQIPIVAAAFVVAYLVVELAGLRYAGPVAIVVALATAVLVLRRGGEAPAGALGLLPMPPLRTLLLALACVVPAYLAAALATVVAVRGFGWPPPQTAALGAIRGNLPLLLGMLAIAWSTAAFGEELLFRGFLLGRLRRLFGDRRGAGAAAAILQALAFAVGHAYQGATGLLVSGAIGLVFGLLALRLRSLWPLIVAHGLIDTIGLLALYAGAVPGA